MRWRQTPLILEACRWHPVIRGIRFFLTAGLISDCHVADHLGWESYRWLVQPASASGLLSHCFNDALRRRPCFHSLCAVASAEPVVPAAFSLKLPCGTFLSWTTQRACQVVISITGHLYDSDCSGLLIARFVNKLSLLALPTSLHSYK